MKGNYLKEMVESGYRPENIDVFHRFCLPYLGSKFFPNRDVKILDIGAGLGHSLIPLKLSDYQNLWAADIDDFNQDLFKKNNIKFNSFNAEEDKFPYEDGFFDVVLSFHLIEHLLNPQNYLEEVHRILKNGGKFILVTPDWRKQYKTFWRDHTHIHPYDKESIVRILKCYDFEPIFTKSFGVLRGLGRIKVWKIIEQLMFTGIDIISISKKK